MTDLRVLLALICAACAAASAAAQTTAEPVAAPAEPVPAPAQPRLPADQDVFDAARRTARSTAEWLARSVDSWFGDRPFEQGGKVTDGRLSLHFLHRRDEGNDLSLRFNARFRLPNVERNTYLFLGRDNVREVVTDRPGAFTRQDRLVAEDTTERKFFAGVGYDLRDDLDFRLGFRGGLKPYAQVRYRQPWRVGDRGLMEFRQTFFWTLQDHLGSTTALSYERALSSTLALRWLNAGTVTQRTKELEWSSGLGLTRAFAEERRLSGELLVEGMTGSGVAVREYGLEARWQQPLHRRWLLGELILGRFWARPDALHAREAVWAVGANLKMRF